MSLPDALPNTFVSDMVCYECVAGKYSTTVSAGSEIMCLSCAARSNSRAGSNKSKDGVCNVGSSGEDSGPCHECIAGKYSEPGGSTQFRCVVRRTPTPGAILHMTEMWFFSNNSVPILPVSASNDGSSSPSGE